MSEVKAKRLDTNTELVRAFSKKDAEKVYKSAASKRFRRLIFDMRQEGKKIYTSAELDEISKGKQRFRHTFCGFEPSDENQNGSVNLIKTDSNSYVYQGLAKCGAVWRCPICSLKILKGRAKEIYQLTSAHNRTGQKMGMVTLTIRHNKKDTLKDLSSLLISKYRGFQNLRLFRKIKEDGKYIGQIKSYEITYTYKNGWHPHLHIIFFWASDSSQWVEDTQNELLKKWVKYTKGSIKAQCQKVVYSSEDLGEYISKWDAVQELTNDFAKSSKGIKPFGLLSLLAQDEILPNYKTKKNSDKKAKAMFSEYIEATKGSHRIGISRELNKLYKVVSKSDDELLKEVNIDSVIMEISRNAWKVICNNQLQPHIIDICYENQENEKNIFKEVFQLLNEFDNFDAGKTDNELEQIKIFLGDEFE